MFSNRTNVVQLVHWPDQSIAVTVLLFCKWYTVEEKEMCVLQKLLGNPVLLVEPKKHKIAAASLLS